MTNLTHIFNGPIRACIYNHGKRQVTMFGYKEERDSTTSFPCLYALEHGCALDPKFINGCNIKDRGMR